MANFFIERPVFAWVIAILIMLSGLISLRNLPIEYTPNLAMPGINISASHAGADAETVVNSITQVIEQGLTNIDGMQFMTSSSSTGYSTIMLNFISGTNIDVAQMKVQNLVQQVIPKLSNSAQRSVRVRQASGPKMPYMIVAFVSDGKDITQQQLDDFASSVAKESLNRLPGVGSVNNYNADLAMYISLKPHRLRAFHLTPQEISQAIKNQNSQAAIGSLGNYPISAQQEFNALVIYQPTLRSVSEFEKILLKVDENGTKVYLSDVAEVSLSSTSSTKFRYNGNPAAILFIEKADYANALSTAAVIKTAVATMSASFPPGMKAVYPVDSSPFIDAAINGILSTLVEAILFVCLIMYLFLQNWRMTLIPTIAIPIVLLGSFTVLLFFGFTINQMTLFGLVLAIGLLVDDAIVVVENVARIMQQEKLSAIAATKKSMKEIQSALLGITLVIAAVFVPLAFLSGMPGMVFRQFTVTIVTAMALSLIVAMTITPALCASILEPVNAISTTLLPRRSLVTRLNDQFKKFFSAFNHVEQRIAAGYVRIAEMMLNKKGRYFILYGGVLIAIVIIIVKLPSRMMPIEDMGSIMSSAYSPIGTSREHAEQAFLSAENYWLQDTTHNIEGALSMVDESGDGNIFIRLKDWKERPHKTQHASAIAKNASKHLSHLKEAEIFTYNPGEFFGGGSGIDLWLVDRGNVGREVLLNSYQQLTQLSKSHPDVIEGIEAKNINLSPHFKLHLNHEKMFALGIEINNITQTLSTALTKSYVDDFIYNERLKSIYLQGEMLYRMAPADLSQWFVRSRQGEMIPISAVAHFSIDAALSALARYNGMPALNMSVKNTEKSSSGEVITLLEKIITESLPGGIGYELGSSAYLERQLQQQMPVILGLAMLVIFLSLAALYESWAIPFAIILVVPLGIIGVLLAAKINHFQMGIYLQLSLIITIALSARNAIMIVEFAKHAIEQEGKSLLAATRQGLLLRFRPIMMTALSFLLGILPLAWSSGAGSGAQNVVGISLIGGILTGTFFVIFFAPLFWVVIYSTFVVKKSR